MNYFIYYVIDFGVLCGEFYNRLIYILKLIILV